MYHYRVKRYPIFSFSYALIVDFLLLEDQVYSAVGVLSIFI